MLSDEERDRLAAICHEAFLAEASRPVLHWGELGGGSRRHWRHVADAAAAALLPPGTVAIPEAELAALRAVAEAVVAALPHLLIFDEERDKMAALKGAVAAIQSGDRDPLPEGG